MSSMLDVCLSLTIFLVYPSSKRKSSIKSVADVSDSDFLVKTAFNFNL